MTTEKVSLPEALKSFVDEQVAGGAYGTSSEYVRELIRRDQARQGLHRLLLDGATSPPTTVADGAYFDALRERAVGHGVSPSPSSPDAAVVNRERSH
jgi:antitoxin ParD1/3/4